MGKKVAIIQSSYIPWKGYFDFINSVDHFLLLDDVQYTKRDWRNRNLVKTSQGLRWLTVPVEVEGKFNQKICEVKIAKADWAEQHWKTLTHLYAQTSYFANYKESLGQLYEKATNESHLSSINLMFVYWICNELKIETPISYSMEYKVSGAKSQRLLELCLSVGATEYVSGPAAKCYLEEELFESHGIKVSYFDYSAYPEYEQLYPPFAHGVSIFDLLFHTGKNAPRFMKSLLPTMSSGK